MLTQTSYPLSQQATSWYVAAMERLVLVVQELSHVTDLDSLMAIVRDAARDLTGADGATFVLRDGDQCYYAEENAISALWKGKRFPMKICISGWVMKNAENVAIEDIYKDSRIPADAYRPTFVKSLAMVPIRRANPIGAIGNYWATNHRATSEEIAILQALADTTSVAMENVNLYSELQHKITQLKESNYELSRFAWVASHDLQQPLCDIVGQIEALSKHLGTKLDDKTRSYIQNTQRSATQLQSFIANMLVHAQVEKTEKFKPTALEHVLADALKNMQSIIMENEARIDYQELPWVWGDPALLCQLFQNLIDNAIKFRSDYESPVIRITSEKKDDMWLIAVEDNGIGMESKYCERVFELFQHLNPQEHYPGSGIGLAASRKIVTLHEGRIWLESAKDKGTTVFFTLPSA